jgi:broad specificity phosphatase PhoE
MSTWHKIYLVRHGLAAASWDEDTDPGLSPVGHDQAANAAQTLADLGPLPVVTSPMRRTQETAAAFEKIWGSAPTIEPRISEIPSPSMALDQRREWLQAIMVGRWTDAPALATDPHDLPAWRKGTVETLLELTGPTVITSHFVAINAIVGQVIGDDLVVGFAPDNCSITIIESDGQSLRLVEKGTEAQTEVG